MASSSIWAALSQVATLGMQGIAALVILLVFGKGTDTDAVFAAYGLYGLVVLMCQTLRLSVVARLAEGPSPWAAFDRLLGAGLCLVAIAVVIQLAAGNVIADLLTGDLGSGPQHLARTTLDILCLAIAGQLIGALGAAMLAVRNEFRFAGIAFVLGGALSIVVLLALQGSLGIKAAPTGVAAGSALTAAMMLWRLWSYGYRPRIGAVLAATLHLRTAVMLLVGSAAPLLFQLNFVISLAFAARLGAGMVTIYTGAFFAAAVIVAVTGSAASLVLAAPISQTWDGDADALLPHLRTVMRAGLIVIAPAVWIAALVGDDLVQLVLGSSFTSADADRIVATLVALSGMLVAQLALPIPLLAAFAMSRYGAVAALAAVGTVVHVVLTAVALSLDEIAWFGVAASVSSLTTVMLLLWLVHRRGFGRAAAIVFGEVAIVAAATATTFGPAAIVAALLGSGAWGAAAAIVGLGGFAVVLRFALPRHAAVLVRMAAPIVAPLRSAAVG